MRAPHRGAAHLCGRDHRHVPGRGPRGAQAIGDTSGLGLRRDPPEVHLWIADPTLLDEDRTAAYLPLCNDAERARYERITHPETRRHHLVTRALVRTTLSRYAAVAPADWCFEDNAHGCPHIAPDQNADDLRFNLSHTSGLIVCAVTRGRDVGVDVEYEPRKSKTAQIADRFFAPPEVTALHRLPESAQRERFFAYWTLKEAYIKGRGMGLAIPLKHFWFDVDTPGRVRFDNDPSLGDDPASWSFVRLRPSPAHPLAIGLRCPPSRPFTVRTFRTTPLEHATEETLDEVARSVR